MILGEEEEDNESSNKSSDVEAGAEVFAEKLNDGERVSFLSRSL